MISKILDNHKLSLLSLALLITSTHNSANANGLTFPNNNILLNDAVYQQKVNGKEQPLALRGAVNRHPQEQMDVLQ